MSVSSGAVLFFRFLESCKVPTVYTHDLDFTTLFASSLQAEIKIK